MSRPPAPVPDATPRDDELATQLRETLAALRPFTREAPRVGLVLGSGLGGVAEALGDRVDMAARDLPHWPVSTVPGHAGRLLFGRWRGTRVVALSGRTHRYEGYPLARVTYPVRVLEALGARTIVLTNSAGSTQREIRPGELMLVRDHVNFLGRRGLFTRDELRARSAGRRVAACYSAELAEALRAAASAGGLTLRQGTLFGTHGPAYETAAEIRMAQALGADAVCMSTVHEATLAAELGCAVAAISCIVNYATGLAPTPLTHDEVTANAGRIAVRLRELLDRWFAAA